MIVGVSLWFSVVQPILTFLQQPTHESVDVDHHCQDGFASSQKQGKTTHELRNALLFGFRAACLSQCW